MPRNPKYSYVIVQHSAAARGNTMFDHGLQEVAEHRASVLRRVEKAGGKVFDEYTTAYEYCMSQMYPQDGGGIMPSARGSFHPTIALEGLPIYLPDVPHPALKRRKTPEMA